MLYRPNECKQAYIFMVSKNLPIRGWFQRCLVCDTITAQKQLYKINNGIYMYYYRCSPCKKKYLREIESLDIDNWMDYQINKYKYKLI